MSKTEVAKLQAAREENQKAARQAEMEACSLEQKREAVRAAIERLEAERKSNEEAAKQQALRLEAQHRELTEKDLQVNELWTRMGKTQAIRLRKLKDFYSACVMTVVVICIRTESTSQPLVFTQRKHSAKMYTKYCSGQ